ELLHEPRLRGLRRRLEDERVDGDLVNDLVDEARAHLARGPVDPGGAALAALGDHLPGPGVERLLDPLDPLVGRVDDLGVLGTDLREDGEVARDLLDQPQLALAWDLERAARDLHVREALLAQPALDLVELPAGVNGLEQRPAADDRRLQGAVERDLL